MATAIELDNLDPSIDENTNFKDEENGTKPKKQYWYDKQLLSFHPWLLYQNGEPRIRLTAYSFMAPILSHPFALLATIAALILLDVCYIWVFPDSLSTKAWFTLISCVIAFGVMLADICSPTLVFFWLMALYTASEVLLIEQALVGFCNQSVITIAFLFVVAAGLEETGAMYYLSKYVLGSPKYLTTGMIRLCFPICAISAFINNTPIVALMIPVCQVWCHQTGIPVSKTLMPLSFATILGGTLTNIGTSTNLVVVALAEKLYPNVTIGFFDVGYAGLPAAICGLIYLVIISRFLPLRENLTVKYLQSPQEFTYAVEVGPQLNGKPVSKVRDLHGIYLFEIERGDEIIAAPAPEQALSQGDILKFTGDIRNGPRLFEINGLIPPTKLEKVGGRPSTRVLVEATISHRSPLISLTPKEYRFRSKYDAAIIAVSRLGERIDENICDIVIRPGDSLLLEASQHFIDQWSQDRTHFSYCSVLGNGIASRKPNHLLLLLCISATVVMISLNIAEKAELFITSCFIFVGYVTIRILSWRQALQKMCPEILLQIAASFVLGEALNRSGAAKVVGDELIKIFEPAGSFGVLYGCYIITAIFTAILTNAASVNVVLPITVSFVESGLVTAKAVVIIVMLSASCDFMTSIGYQTNIMVAGAAGYKFSDFTKWGSGLTLIVSIVGTIFVQFFYNGDAEGVSYTYNS